MPFATPQAALQFYRETINAHRFEALLPVLSEDVVFWFSSGSHVGLAGARKAFEDTWARIAAETYWLEDVRWLSETSGSAACIYQFRWKGLVNGVPTAGGGRGTTVLRRERDGWVIVHEHLSAEPAK